MNACLEEELAKTYCGKEYRLTARVGTGNKEERAVAVNVVVVNYLIGRKTSLNKEKALEIGNIGARCNLCLNTSEALLRDLSENS